MKLRGQWTIKNNCYCIVCMFFILPVVVVRDDSIHVWFTAEFYEVSHACCMYVHAVKSFDDAQVIGSILHVSLNLLLDHALVLS